MAESIESLVERVVLTWRDSLVNLNRRNRLLHFTATKTSTVSIVAPQLDEVLRRVFAKSALQIVALESDEESGSESFAPEQQQALEGVSNEQTEFELSTEEQVNRNERLLGAKSGEKNLRTALRTLQSRSQQTYLDTGLTTLYLAVGTLSWSDPFDPSSQYKSPLVLVPVDLRKPGRRMPPVLTLSEEDISLNPALILKMQTLDFQLPEEPEASAESIISCLLDVQSRARGRSGWSVSRTCDLSYFTFHKEAMYQDLSDNLDAIKRSLLVQALAASGTSHQTDALLFQPVSDELIDEKDVPERSWQVLDADSSQRSAVSAASGGHSFVLEGPPGTGKSQTIANILATQIAEGSKVLFVSEKIAALEVVKNRLEEVGLGSYLLELHSHTATRKAVAEELARSLRLQPQSDRAISESDVARLSKSREKLSSYSAAMNVKRLPLNMSLHDSIGEVARRRDLPTVSPLSSDFRELDPALLAELRELAEGLSRAWRPALEGESFPWAGAKAETDASSDLADALDALRDLKTILEPYESVLTDLNWKGPESGRLFLDLLRAWRTTDPIPPRLWLQISPWTKFKKAIEEIAQTLAEIESIEVLLDADCNSDWRELLLGPSVQSAKETVEALSSLKPALEMQMGSSGQELDSLRDLLQSFREALNDSKQSAVSLAHMLGLNEPAFLVDFENALEVHKLGSGGHRPERDWLKTEVDSKVGDAIVELESANERLVVAEQRAIEFFRPEVLELDLDLLQTRFVNVYRGVKKLSGGYRQDKRLIQDVCRPGISTASAIEKLTLALEWRDAQQGLALSEANSAALLGSRYRGAKTDWVALRQALETARGIARIADTAILQQLMDAVGFGNELDPQRETYGKSLDKSLARVRAAIERSPLTVLQDQSKARNVQALIDWSAAVLEGLQNILRDFDSSSRYLTVSPSLESVMEFQARIELRSQLGADLESRRSEVPPQVLESLGHSADSSGALVARIRAAGAIREVASRQPGSAGNEATPIPDGAIEFLLGSVPTDLLSAAYGAWVRRRDLILDYFDQDHQLAMIGEFLSWEDAVGRLEDLQGDDSGQAEWFAFQEARSRLSELGLAVLVRELEERRVGAGEVAEIIVREVFSAWTSFHLETDRRLHPTRSTDREALAEEFKALDRRLVDLRVANIIETANERRPQINQGQSKIIDSEAQKRTRHRPIRTLIRETVDVVQALKPVFMMSPLSVSQFLDPSIKFDLVIFDEASQVKPEDAINCIYRAKQLVIAGDDRQLPPTNFFEIDSMLDLDEKDWEENDSSAHDFESILSIAKGSGAFTSISLKWHYRSRHEDLITFSNRRFYDGQLITFPSAASDQLDPGVEFLKVPNGVYARGGAKNNWPEARFVAERIEHHFDARPGLSLGVVALSQAQADAIESAKDEMLDRRPDLEQYFEESRLDGFFVKNLESVQGDERDVMILSIGYGPDEHGKFLMTFGPMSQEKGWRRLNVAVTRARIRTEVIASFNPSEMSPDLKRSASELRRYLDYAQRGVAALALSDLGSLGDVESPFEESVHSWLISQGFDVVTQVGSSSYRIDMAICRPGRPGEYVLGIECDGVAYHSSKAARDRDRLREQVLRGLGWELHRIWGTAWYRNQREEQDRLLRAIENALSSRKAGVLGSRGADRARATPVISEVEIPLDETPEWVEAYVRAEVRKPPRLVDPSDVSAVPHLIQAIKDIVDVEGPVHTQVVTERIKESWGIRRVTASVQINIESAIRQSRIRRDGQFLYRGNLEELVPTRQHDGESRREIAEIHPREIEDTAWRIAMDAVAISKDDLVLTTARYLGFQRLRVEARDVIDSVIEDLRVRRFLLGGDQSLGANHPD